MFRHLGRVYCVLYKHKVTAFYLLIVCFNQISSAECYTQEDNKKTLYLSFVFGLHFPLVLIFIISYYCILKPCVRWRSQKQSYSNIGSYAPPTYHVTINPSPTYIPAPTSSNITSSTNAHSVYRPPRTSRYAAATHNTPVYVTRGPSKHTNRTGQRLAPNTAGMRPPPNTAVARPTPNTTRVRPPPNTAGVWPPPNIAGARPGPSKRAPGYVVNKTTGDRLAPSTEHHLEDVTIFAHHVKTLVYRLWKAELVGIGRDAHSTGLKYITVIRIQRNRHTPLLTRYKDRKRKLKKKKTKIEFMESLGALTSSAVETTEFLGKYFPRSELLGAVAGDLNEHYLFHGTKRENIASICRNGLRINTANVGMFGKGIYFAENPTKADQYTDIIGDKVIFLMRVCLGELYIHTAGATSHFTSPPCRECHTHGCTQHKYTYDSAVACLHRLNFREFVVYRNYRAYPEYVITYRRTHDSSDMDSFRM